MEAKNKKYQPKKGGKKKKKKILTDQPMFGT